VTVVVDTAPVVALADKRDPLHRRIDEILGTEIGELVIPAPAIAEIDYLLGRRLGRQSRLAFLDDLVAGRFTVADLDSGDYAVIAELERQYHDVDAGLTDLSAIVVAARYQTNHLVTFDQRHFRTLRPLEGGHFTLLPSDEGS
jgi:predicted nucleic acid-binding protein